jgi:Cd2+/Zn2+-exporting ATPase
LNRDQRKVSVATLGEIDVEPLKLRLNSVIRALDEIFGEGGFQTKAALSAPAEGRSPFQLRSLPGEDLLIEKPSCPTAPRLWRWREFAWPETPEPEKEHGEEWRTLALQASLCGASLLLGWLLEHYTTSSSFVWIGLYGLSIIAGGWDAAGEVWRKIRHGNLEIHFLMLSVAAGAVAIGAWTEGALLLFLFSTSGALEHYALHRTHREIDALTKAAPKTARVLLPGGVVEERLVSSLRIADVLQVRPDELFPVDGSVLSGETAADESNLTGESVPVAKQMGAPVYGGTLNLWGAVHVRVEKLSTESALQRIISLIQHAQHLRAPSQRFTDRFGTPYTWLVLGLTAAMFFVWWLVFEVAPFRGSEENRSAFYRAMTLLVVMSPCALALSIPSAILAAIAWGARHGILFRGGAAIEKLAEVDVVCMDKTGTLTEGAMRVVKVESFPPGFEPEIALIAFSLDSQSNHPVSRAITSYGKAQSLEPYVVTRFERLTGAGLRGVVNGEACYIGRRELMQQEAFKHWLGNVPDTPLGYSEVWVLSPKTVGRILLQDSIRKGSRAALEAMKADGLRTIMLTGDRQAAAEEVGRDLGLSEVRSGLKPEDKVETVRRLTKEGRKVAMIGDGVNDAPSLAAAYVSVAMGARGSDAALEQSDVVLMEDRIDRFATARLLSRRSRRIIQENLAISLGAIAIMATAALLGAVPLTLGVLAHEGSTVVVCLNSLRLLFGKE